MGGEVKNGIFRKGRLWNILEKQEYRITLQCNTACNFKFHALTRTVGIPRTEVLRQLILNVSDWIPKEAKIVGTRFRYNVGLSGAGGLSE